MKYELRRIRRLLCLSLVFLLAGFCTAASAPERVPLGAGLLLGSTAIALAAIFPAVRFYRLRRREDGEEDR